MFSYTAFERYVPVVATLIDWQRTASMLYVHHAHAIGEYNISNISSMFTVLKKVISKEENDYGLISWALPKLCS
jgi:hypothetical protein